MSNAFGISEDDILIVIQQDGLVHVVNDADVSAWMDDLDCDAIESAALNYDDMDEQTNAAHDSIREQLKGMGVYEELNARVSRQQMESGTPVAPPATSMPRP